ncbi:putative zinc-binding metallopeptidase [Verrucomicrobium sp. BvORR034]|uniref:putative zinc-binding metallopeptidase n=1 Tax=Verrucomicrobium sp. BvORR034 TaxID=1396418 RepID=UPI0009DF56E1|nr:putative zinc-binding metallopeptidase [Verrucomicrobium sp. BvORR034]
MRRDGHAVIARVMIRLFCSACLMQRFLCPCGNTLFFDSTSCLACRRPVACDPARKAFVVLESTGPAPARLCANGVQYGVCNWLAMPGQQGGLCLSCQMDRMIPNLGDRRNVMLWGKVEAAKRRLIFEMIGLGIPMTPGGRNLFDGLTFRIVSTRLDSGVTMGHLNGLITVNLEEADDTYRQINRQTLGEESRTLLGHFRHESGHFVWQQWFDALPWNHAHRLAFRECFGDERQDYSWALYHHYAVGNACSPDNFISAYASCHPWEDWAETWAHYLQMMDGLQTFHSLGLDLSQLTLTCDQFEPTTVALPGVLGVRKLDDAEFLLNLSAWLQVAAVLNELSASAGQPMLYPFVIDGGVARKLRLIHYFVQTCRQGVGR